MAAYFGHFKGQLRFFTQLVEAIADHIGGAVVRKAQADEVTGSCGPSVLMPN